MKRTKLATLGLLFTLGTMILGTVNVSAATKKVTPKQPAILGLMAQVHGGVVSKDGFGGAWIYNYADGYSVMHANQFTEIMGFDKKYIIDRIDFSDGLLDIDGNGIDDRDPSNSCGYTDLNFNCIADGAPIAPDGYWLESQYWGNSLCKHGVVGGSELCRNPECVAEMAYARWYLSNCVTVE